jgi:hypothetical protein
MLMVMYAVVGRQEPPGPPPRLKLCALLLRVYLGTVANGGQCRALCKPSSSHAYSSPAVLAMNEESPMLLVMLSKLTGGGCTVGPFVWTCWGS